MMQLLKEPSDLFKSPSIESTPQGYVEVDTLFCDSSGFGREGEMALTKEQAENKAKELIGQHSDQNLYSAITNIGQFQVYVTIFTKE